MTEQVKFPFNKALPLAKTLWALGETVESTETTRNNKAKGHGLYDGSSWQGKYQQDFVGHMKTANTEAPQVKSSLQATAKGLAQSWAMAQHQQQTYNYYAAVKEKRDQVSGWDSFWGDDTDYGKPPAAPEVPSPPDFAPTAVPQGKLPS